MVRRDRLATGRRLRMIALGLTVGLLSAGSSFAQAPNQRLFPNDGGMVLNFIKKDKEADFEEVIAKLKEALAKSDNPQRKQQAEGWKVFKSPDPAGANTLYVFIIDPSVKDADYQVSNIITEGFGNTAETNEILKKYAEAYAQGMNIVNLNLIQNLGN